MEQQISDKFHAYKCLMVATGVSDEQLAAWLSHPVIDPNDPDAIKEPTANYEDAVSEIVATWLHALTDVPWVRGNHLGPRPAGQYGTVCVLRKTPTGCEHTSQRKFKGEILETVSCETRITLQLDVYRDRGTATDCENPTPHDGLIGSAFDVLSRAGNRMKHRIHQAAIGEYGLRLFDSGVQTINNVPQQRQGAWESRASADLELIGTECSTIGIPALRKFEVGDKDGDVLCTHDLTTETENMEKLDG